MCMGTSMNNDASREAIDTVTADETGKVSTAVSAVAAQRLQDHDLLGFRLNPGTIGDYIHFIGQAITGNRRETVFYHNLHSLYSYFTSKRLRECYDRDGIIVLADGMPLIWLMKICQLLKLSERSADREQRVTYVDFIWPMLEAAEKNNWKVYHVGQEKSVQEKALETIRERLPGLQIAGHDGYFDQSDNSKDSLQVVDAINRHETDLLLVGFGAPKQEYWLDAHRENIDAAAVFTCGACMEYVAGAVKTPPRWMGKAGLEWLYRLAENPRRFAFRYLVEPILLGFFLLRNLVLKRTPPARIANRMAKYEAKYDTHGTGAGKQAENRAGG